MRPRIPPETPGVIVPRPEACPFCRSRDLTTTSRSVTKDSYWRCVSCGEIWNAERLESGTRWASRYR